MSHEAGAREPAQGKEELLNNFWVKGCRGFDFHAGIRMEELERELEKMLTEETNKIHELEAKLWVQLSFAPCRDGKTADELAEADAKARRDLEEGKQHQLLRLRVLVWAREQMVAMHADRLRELKEERDGAEARAAREHRQKRAQLPGTKIAQISCIRCGGRRDAKVEIGLCNWEIAECIECGQRHDRGDGFMGTR